MCPCLMPKSQTFLWYLNDVFILDALKSVKFVVNYKTEAADAM